MRDVRNGAAGVSPTRMSPTSGLGEEHGRESGESVTQLGSVRIARRVLRTVVEQAALGVRGVAGMAHARGGLQQVVGRSLPQHGVSLAVHGDRVGVELYLIVAPGAHMVEVGTQVQEAVGAAVEHILGMTVSEINVYIQDVA
ncbi:MAG: Asp23/Gls24 family envelope stress response protein [Ktedonobacterales bacterium]